MSGGKTKCNNERLERADWERERPGEVARRCVTIVVLRESRRPRLGRGKEGEEGRSRTTVSELPTQRGGSIGGPRDPKPRLTFAWGEGERIGRSKVKTGKCRKKLRMLPRTN